MDRATATAFTVGRDIGTAAAIATVGVVSVRIVGVGAGRASAVAYGATAANAYRVSIINVEAGKLQLPGLFHLQVRPT